MKKPEKSAAEIEIEREINDMNNLISKQLVRINDAEILVSSAIKIWMKCEELRKSRDKWRIRAEIAEAKLK